MQLYTVYLYLETALYVSDGTSTHYQELIQLYLHQLVFMCKVTSCWIYVLEYVRKFLPLVCMQLMPMDAKGNNAFNM
jgi:hypothetical protein